MHFCAHQLFDKIAQQEEDEDLKDEVLLADEMIEDCDDDDDDDDETEAWISSNRDRSEEEYKPAISVATSSSSWCEDAYEKPSLVV